VQGASHRVAGGEESLGYMVVSLISTRAAADSKLGDSLIVVFDHGKVMFTARPDDSF
jgi:hypothetical protein